MFAYNDLMNGSYAPYSDTVVDTTGYPPRHGGKKKGAASRQISQPYY